MRIAVIQGKLCLLAETPRDGYDIGRLRVEAELAGKHLKIEGDKHGQVAIAVPLHDMELAQALGFDDKDRA